MSEQTRADLDQAESLLRSGQSNKAAEIFRRVLAKVPDQSRALTHLALRAQAQGDLNEAAALADRAARGEPQTALAHAVRGSVHRMSGQLETAVSALRSALALDASFLPARFDLAEALQDLGQNRDACREFREALQAIPSDQALPPGFNERVQRARQAVAEEDRELEALLGQRMDASLAALDSEERDRALECYEITRGRSKPKQPKPSFMFFPGLPVKDFYPRSMFPWVEEVEAMTDTIREELSAALSEQDSRFTPYVQKNERVAGPGSVWEPLNHSRDWGVYFLFNQGERVDRHCASCPKTAALLDSLPLVDIPGRGPTAFFSRLKPGTHIPPHHGATNTRLIVHLPLIVPEGCGFRVGNTTREWQPGETLIFDDTVEHEAWNRGPDTRVVLIFDVWNPYLSERERDWVREVTATMAEFFPERQHVLED